MPHTLLALDVDPGGAKVIWPEDLPGRTWLRLGTVSSAQQAFGDALLDRYPLAVVPSVVSTRSWNLLIDVPTARGRLTLNARERFVLDPRLAARRN